MKPVSNADMLWYNEIVRKSDMELAKNVVSIVRRFPTSPSKVDFWSATIFMSTMSIYFGQNGNTNISEQIEDIIIRWEYERELMESGKFPMIISSQDYMNILFKITDDMGMTDSFYNDLMYDLDKRVDSIKENIRLVANNSSLIF